MAKTVEHVHWPDAPDMWMPYAPAIKVKGGTTIYLAGVTAAPVYHHHPHRPEEFDSMPRDMEGQARAALENLKRGLEAVGATFADVVTADRFVTDLSDQDAFNRVWGEYFRDAKPATTTVQVVLLATGPGRVRLLSAERTRLGTHPPYSATSTAPSAISATPSQLSMVSFSPSNSAPKIATSTTLSLSTGAICEALPSLSARK